MSAEISVTVDRLNQGKINLHCIISVLFMKLALINDGR